MTNESFKIEQLDQVKAIKMNNLSQVTNPILFNSKTGPTPDGLLSNEIFGVSTDNRAGIFAYIDLEDYFIQPYFYKIWSKIDKNIKAIVYETKSFKLDSHGYLVEDDNGSTGIEFLRKNIKNIKFKDTKRDLLTRVLNENKDLMFTNKFIIIPPFYRDINNNNGRIGVGEINKLYTTLMNNIKALKETNDYGLAIKGGIKGKIQDMMLEIYNWFTIGESVAGGEHTGAGIFKKYGVMKRSVESKTSDYSARLVISAPRTNMANSKRDAMVDMEYSSIPLSAALTVFYPFIIYKLREFFGNEFGGKANYPVVINGKPEYVTLKNPQIEFSDDRFDKEINEFLHGYSNRFKKIEIPNEENKEIYLSFKGYKISPKEYANGIRENSKIVNRYITWCDLFYIIASEVVEDKMVLVTRYPMDSYFNQFPTKVRVSSTTKTESMVINGKIYKWYPYITENLIGADTSDLFIDTFSFLNPYCKLMGADYDGDQVTIKGAFSVEANKELLELSRSNANLIAVNGIDGRISDHEAIQAMYNMTKIYPNTKLTDPVF